MLPLGFPLHPALLLPDDQRAEVAYEGWERSLANVQSFYVMGTDKQLSAYRIPDVKAVYAVWPQAHKVLVASDWWNLPFNWSDRIAYQQFLRAQSGNPVLFSKAASIVLTIAVAAAQKDENQKVFADMKIIPACFHIDGFDQRKYSALLQGVPMLIKEALEYMDQSNETLLIDMAKGFGVTKNTAERFRRFISERFPNEPIGKVTTRQVRRTDGFVSRHASHLENVLV
ncbi:MAG: hypothetical protein ABR863_12555 [Roseiarcus sp.]|jgi:hypothetical protein